MDLTQSVEPRSDQINADDLIAGPQTYTVTGVSKGSVEQPINIHLAETERAWRPSKSMRRVLINAWGKDGDSYVGRRVTLYRDPEVTFGRDKVGGIKISHASHIERPLTLALTVTRGKRANHTIDPLPDSAPTATVEPTADDVAGCDDIDRLRDMYRASATNPERQAQITERVAELSTDKDN